MGDLAGATTSLATESAGTVLIPSQMSEITGHGTEAGRGRMLGACACMHTRGRVCVCVCLEAEGLRGTTRLRGSFFSDPGRVMIFQ